MGVRGDELVRANKGIPSMPWRSNQKVHRKNRHVIRILEKKGKGRLGQPQYIKPLFFFERGAGK